MPAALHARVEATRAYRQRRREAEAEAEATWKAIKAHSEKLRRWEAERRARVEERLGIRPRHTGDRAVGAGATSVYAS